ncbi:MAG: hypothetical protein ABIG60_05365 [Patescibacteria group bacterium]
MFIWNTRLPYLELFTTFIYKLSTFPFLFDLQGGQVSGGDFLILQPIFEKISRNVIL